MSDAGEATGRVLSARHQALITASAISDEVATARGYRSVTTKAELGRLGFTAGQQCVPALLLPIWGVAGGIISYQIRPDEPRIGKDGKPDKYLFPRGSRMVLDVHPQIRDRIGNPAMPLWITEGVRKADAAISEGLCCIAVIGVWNWRGTNEHGGKTVLADWESIALNGRDVYIAFDSDVMVKPQVYGALERLGAFLTSRKSHVRYVYLPSGPGGIKVGLDDYLAAGHRVDDLLALASSDLRRSAPDSAHVDQPYFVTEAGTFWRRPMGGGMVDVPLADFSALIRDEIVEDDGAEEQRIYGIDATVRTKPQRIEVPAAQFAGMTWVGEYLGARAILEPGSGTKDRIRHAIQILSGEISVHRVYTHTGWRQINGMWVYLHGAGAIGPDGSVPGVAVALKSNLARFVLPNPPRGKDLVNAICGAVRLFELLPSEVAYPLLGATWLAPLQEPLGAESADFTVWMHGPSGQFKSEAAALGQAFYGDFTRKTLPLNFLSTPNAVERALFEAKDAFLVVDDYHPTSDSREQLAMNQVANRLLRSAGNRAGRHRMGRDLRLRAAFDPRGLAFATGERLPDGYSNTARAFPIAVTPGAIALAHLITAQDQRHHYPAALAGFLQHLSARFEEHQERLPQHFRALRTELHVTDSHRREPGQIAHLLLGLETFLDFAVAVDAIAPNVREEHLAQARQVLLGQGREHALAQAEETPEQLFLRYLRDGFAGKQAYLEQKGGGCPIDPALWGWERYTPRDSVWVDPDEWRHQPSAKLVGVLASDWLLLFPEQVYQFVVGAAKAAGRAFSVDQATLIRRLDEANLIATEMESGERRRIVKAWIGGASRRVLKLRRDAVILPSPAENREDREDREDLSPGGAYRGAAHSRMDGKGVASGKVLPEENRVMAPLLPGLPGLPAASDKGGESETKHEEVVEWRG